MKRVIITGATGFVGANLARRLLRDGHRIHLLVRPGFTPWRIEAIHKDVQLHTVDLENGEDLDHVVNSIRPDWVFHLATYGAYPAQTDLRRMVQTNVVGTINLAESCLKVGFEAFVNTGSSSEYGFKDHPPSEVECLEPNSHYAVTKAAATLFCRYTAQHHKVRLLTLRLYSVYGPYEEPTRLIPTLILRGSVGELPPLVDPSIARDYVYVDDVSEAYLAAAARTDLEPGAVYNVGTGAQTSIGEVVTIARRVMGIAAEPKWGSMPGRLWDTKVWAAENRKAREELGWQPTRTFEQGFRETSSWFRDNPLLHDLYYKRIEDAQ